MPRETRHDRPDVGPAATLAYGTDSPNQVVDLYAPGGDGPWPLIVAIHGGAFMRGNRGGELPHVPELLERGYAVASIEYRLSGEALFPAAVQDVKRQRPTCARTPPNLTWIPPSSPRGDAPPAGTSPRCSA
jgi:acetyl esterase/lipase